MSAFYSLSAMPVIGCSTALLTRPTEFSCDQAQFVHVCSVFSFVIEESHGMPPKHEDYAALGALCD